MKKKFVAIMMVAAMAASMAACGSDGGSSDTQKGGSSTTTSDVANKDKPLVWFNRQPSNSSTGIPRKHQLYPMLKALLLQRIFFNPDRYAPDCVPRVLSGTS